MRALAVGLLVTGIAFALASPAWATEPFGVESFENTIVSNAEGAAATQAGSHPYAVTTTVVFDHEVTEEKETFKENLNEEEAPLGEPEVFARVNGNPRHLEVDLPAGLVLNPSATSVKCTEAQLETSPGAGGSCPVASAVGTIGLYVNGFGEKIKGAVYNMAPPPGVPAELGVDPGGVGLVIHIVGKVRTGGDYGFSVDVSEIGQAVSVYGLELTLWGDPSEEGHDAQRGICASRGSTQKAIEKEFWEYEEREDGESTKEYRFSCPAEGTDTPLLTMPGACTGQPLETKLSVNSWQDPEEIEPTPATSPAVTGCGALVFTPTLEVAPMLEASSTTPAANSIQVASSATPVANPTPAAEPTPATNPTQAASPTTPAPPANPAPQVATAESPTGLNVDLKLPHEESAAGLAAADLEQLTVTLPPGMTISLSAANGLEACTNTPEPGRPEGEIALRSDEPARCPEASKLGTAEVVTPLLQAPLKGAVYLAQPETVEGSLIGLYVVLEGSGVSIKLAGRATLDPNTGQVTIALDDAPQLPLGELELSLFGGPRAVLQTPPACGAYTITSQLTPWSGGAPAEPSSELTVGSGPDGGACPSGGFSPSLTAGTTNTRAGAFTPFGLTLSRQSGEQRLAGVRVAMPPGLLGIVKGVAQCPEPQASAGKCPPASAIGTTTVGAGSGLDPLYLPAPGRPPDEAYLTGPYEGAPFGLSIVVPAIAGPFDLGDIVIRAKIEVDPHTAAITVVSDPLPIIKDGIPLDIRTIGVNVDRGDFMFNPTHCAPQAVAGAIASAGGLDGVGAASATVSSPFAAVSCAGLPFKPAFSASTAAKASKAGGAGLVVKVSSKGGPQPGGGEANIKSVKVDLPKRLPSRLTTLQKACPAGVFATNPAACPAPSLVGAATASTPMLANQLTGPAYLVSHGGLALPDLVIVLQGEGITIDLEGQTNIRRGVTSSTFRSLPDAPLSTFDLVLPAGPHSLLGANLPTKARWSLCSQTLNMPTAITAQNGAVVKQTTKLAVTGCPKQVKGKHRQARRRQARGKQKQKDR